MQFPTLLNYKLTKLQHDYHRAHESMMGMCPAKDHEGFSATPEQIEEMRFIIDDLAADAISAWDSLMDEIFAHHGVPSGGMSARLKQLQMLNGPVHDLVADVWARLVKRINDVRNEYQHNDFWKNSFGVGQGNGPFTMDIVAPVATPSVYVLRDVRRAAHAIAAIHSAANLPSQIPTFTNPCARCWGDVFLGPPLDWARLDP